LDSILAHQEHIPLFQELSLELAVTQNNGWKMFFFWAYGERNDFYCKLCPKTAELLQTIPGMVTASYSILAPKAEIPVHRGPYKGVLRFHLGLKVAHPEACGIQVGSGTVTRWHEGRGVVFDDSFDHDVWNRSDDTRVVLFVDFIRPLPWPLSVLNRLFVGIVRRSELVQDGVKKQKPWNERLEKAL